MSVRNEQQIRDVLEELTDTFELDVGDSTFFSSISLSHRAVAKAKIETLEWVLDGESEGEDEDEC